MKKMFILIICGLSTTACNPFLGINSWFNKIDYELEKQNDRQRYDRLKKVEDTARAMVSSYESDKQIYLSMKDEKHKHFWDGSKAFEKRQTIEAYKRDTVPMIEKFLAYISQAGAGELIFDGGRQDRRCGENDDGYDHWSPNI